MLLGNSNTIIKCRAGYCQRTVIYVILNIRVRRNTAISFDSDIMFRRIIQLIVYLLEIIENSYVSVYETNNNAE